MGTLGIRGKTLVVGGIALLALAAMSLPGEAGVKPGDFITPDNSAQVKDLVSPGVFYKVQHGMTMKIVPTLRVDWPPPYKDATEKYSSQVQLSKDHRTVVGYVAGQPFPLIDANDPDVATKVVWNNVFRPIQSDDYDLRYFDCDTVYTGFNKPFFEVAYGQLGHYAGYDLVGRTEVEPLPTDPDFKKTNRLWLFLLGPELAPQDARGTSLLRYRYADPTHGDDTWTWQTGSRRLRRLNEAINSSATGAQTWDPDHYSGFNPKTEQYNYKFLGEKEMLATVDAEHSPEVRCATDGGASACPERWQMRHMYIVTAEPRRSVATTPRRSIPRPSSTWIQKCGSSRTSILTIVAANCSATTSTGWHIAIGRFLTRKSLSILSSANSSSAPLRLTCRAPRQRCATCPASRRRSASAGTSTWAQWTALLHHRSDGEDVRSRPHVA